MTRICLMGHQVSEARRQHGEIGVDGHSALQITQVVVEARPGFIRHELELDVLPLGQAEESISALTEILRKAGNCWLKTVDRHGVRLPPLH